MLLRVLRTSAIHHQIDDGDDEAGEESRRQLSAKDDLCHGTLNLIAGQVAMDGQRNHCQCRAERRHQDGIQTVERTVKDTVMKRHAFILPMVVIGHEQHTVTRGNTEQRDESDDGRDTDFPGGNDQCEHSSNQ